MHVVILTMPSGNISKRTTTDGAWPRGSSAFRRDPFRGMTAETGMLNTLKARMELWWRLDTLYRLARACRRTGSRLLDVIDRGDRRKQRAIERAHQRHVRKETARAQFKETAAALHSDAQVVLHLEEMIAIRLGRRVRHIRSEVVQTAGLARRAHANRRFYAKHWFELSDGVDERLMPLLDPDGLLVVFVKTAQDLRLSDQLELVLSKQEGKGFRAPYFFGSFTMCGLKLGVWEAIEINHVPFANYTLEDQTRVVQAIAAANAVRTESTVPVCAQRLGIKPPRWSGSMYRSMDEEARIRWKPLYIEALDVVRHHDRLLRRLWSTDETLLTHNDLGGGLNISVPPTGDVILFDWEFSTLSFPGADLGILSRVNSGDHLLSCYVSMMAQHGFVLDAAAVRFSLEVVEGYRSVRSGWRDRDADQVERGLALLTRHR